MIRMHDSRFWLSVRLCWTWSACHSGLGISNDVRADVNPDLMFDGPPVDCAI